MDILVSDDQHGQRLDMLAAQAMPRLSRAFVQKLCAQERIAVNGQPAKPGHKLRQGDAVHIDYDEAELDNVPHIDLPIIYEDDDCMVINKPAGVLTHGQGALSSEATVATFLRNIAFKDLSGERAGIVHRLDRATSGVIIGAKHAAALSALQKQFAQRKTKKTYVAIVEGHPAQSEAHIDMPIERNPKAPATFRTGSGGKPARTHYRVVKENNSYSLVELTPETGRTHQLRVHMAKIGHPIVGDPLYGTGHYGDRLYLHAKSLELTLPNRKRRTFTAPVPTDFTHLLEQ